MELWARKILWVVFAISCACSGVANAQSNPFDDTCAIVVEAIDAASASCVNRGRPILSYEYSFGTDASRAGLVLNELIEKYGEPEAVRRTANVWRIPNPGNQLDQKKEVTIILIFDPMGESRIIMDRVRPGTIFATKDRVKKTKPKRNNRGSNKNRPIEPRPEPEG